MHFAVLRGRFLTFTPCILGGFGNGSTRGGGVYAREEKATILYERKLKKITLFLDYFALGFFVVILVQLLLILLIHPLTFDNTCARH
jgi:hypothetical protein